jgi:hypothetical protein
MEKIEGRVEEKMTEPVKSAKPYLIVGYQFEKQLEKEEV